MISSWVWLWAGPAQNGAGLLLTVKKAIRHVGQVESANQMASTRSFEPDWYQPSGPTTCTPWCEWSGGPSGPSAGGWLSVEPTWRMLAPPGEPTVTGTSDS